MATFSLPSELITELETYLQAVGEVYEETNKSAVVAKALKAWIRGKLAEDQNLNAAYMKIVGRPKIQEVRKRD